MHVQFIHQSFNSNGSISLLLAAKYYIAHSKSVITSDRKNSTKEKKTIPGKEQQNGDFG